MNPERRVIVCGGMPRSGTTFLHNCLVSSKGVHRSLIKESNLFYRSKGFINWKLQTLRSDRIYIDSTPTYFFSQRAIDKVAEFGYSPFFIIRDYYSWRESVERYLRLNHIKTMLYRDIDKGYFDERKAYIIANHVHYMFEDLVGKTHELIGCIRAEYGLDAGVGRTNLDQNKNASERRIHFLMSRLESRPLDTWTRRMKSILFGLV